jgi:hypothetical protein
MNAPILRPASAQAVDRESILAAHQRIAPHVRRTPVLWLAGEDLGL